MHLLLPTRLPQIRQLAIFGRKVLEGVYRGNLGAGSPFTDLGAGCLFISSKAGCEFLGFIGLVVEKSVEGDEGAVGGFPVVEGLAEVGDVELGAGVGFWGGGLEGEVGECFLTAMWEGEWGFYRAGRGVVACWGLGSGHFFFLEIGGV